MKKINILLLIIISLWQGIVLAKEPECHPPTKLQKLADLLANKASSLPPASSTVISDVFFGYKYDLISRIVETKFPKEYKDIFNNYIEDFKKIETAYQEEKLSEDDAVVRDFHYYILSDLIPILLNDRLFFDVSFNIPNRNSEKQAADLKVWEDLSQELDFRNLEICKDEESSEKSIDNSLGKNKEYKIILQNPVSKAIDFESNYKIPITYEKFNSDPNAEKIKGKDSNWIKTFWNRVTGNNEEKEKQMKKESIENQITSSSISPKAKIFLAFEREHKIRSRYLDWRNERNFWITKTNQVSGYNLDVFVDKFEAMFDIILKTNDELQQSLEAVEIICQSQRTNYPCWLTTGNKIPSHSNTTKKTYDYRTAESDN